MKMNWLVVIGIVGLLPVQGMAQKTKGTKPVLQPIQLDRPDQTECPFIVPKKRFQAEIGFVYEKTDATTGTFLTPGALWKYGLTDNLEFRLITEFETTKTGKISSGGLSPIKIGFKTTVCEEQGLLPKTSFIGHLAIPYLASIKLKASWYAPSFRFTMQHSLSKKISLGYNIGAEWDGEDPAPVFIYTLTTGYSISEKIGAYIELYGFAPQKDIPTHKIDGGLCFLLKQNMMFDISVGLGLTPNAPRFFIATGFSFRLND